MPLPLPNLDDRTFDDLVEEARAMIPRLAPEWTNYNPSDPGITLIELFAWLTEMMLYRLNRVSDEHYEVFLGLIGITRNKDEPIKSAVARGLRFLQERSRAVSLDDFEQLALAFKSPDTGGVRFKIARAKALANLDLEETTTGLEDAASRREGHVSVIILPQKPVIELPEAFDCITLQQAMKRPDMVQLRIDLAHHLEPRRLLTTVVHVVPPEFRDITLTIKIAGRTGVDAVQLRKAVEKRLHDFIDPYTGGETGAGWPFGQAVRRFEIYQQIEAIASVDHVEDLFLDESLELPEIPLERNQLPCLATLTVASA